jgi:hypothetical protein
VVSLRGKCRMKPFEEYFDIHNNTDDGLFSSSFNDDLFLNDILGSVLPYHYAVVINQVVWNLCEDIRVLKEENAKLGGGK